AGGRAEQFRATLQAYFLVASVIGIAVDARAVPAVTRCCYLGVAPGHARRHLHRAPARHDRPRARPRRGPQELNQRRSVASSSLFFLCVSSTGFSCSAGSTTTGGSLSFCAALSAPGPAMGARGATGAACCAGSSGSVGRLLT